MLLVHTPDSHTFGAVRNLIRLAEDGRCNSPGYNAKYGCNTLIDMKTGLFVDQQPVEVTEAGSSVAIEKTVDSALMQAPSHYS